MTTTRELCRALGAALQVPGVERHAARLVRDGWLPRAGEEADERDAARLLLAGVAAPHPDQASEVVEALMSRRLMFVSKSVAFGVVVENLNAYRHLLPETIIDALAEALEFESLGDVPGLRIGRLSVEHGGLGATIDVVVELPTGPIFLCAQYGGVYLSSGGLRTYAVTENAVLRSVARELHPSEAQRCPEARMPSHLMH